MGLHLRFRAPAAEAESRPQQAAAIDAERRGWRQRLYNGRRRIATLLAALVAFAVGYHVIFGQNGLTVYEQKRQAAHSLTSEADALTAENRALKEHADRLVSDPDVLERQAREQLHYTRPGEVIVTLPPESKQTQVEAADRGPAYLPPWLRHLFTH